MTKNKKSVNTLQQRIENVEKELSEALKKNDLDLTLDIDFPLYKKLPVELVLAVKIFEKHEGTVVKRYKDTKTEKTTSDKK